MKLELRQMQKDIRMALLKTTINYMTPRLLGSLDVKKPSTFQGKILASAFERVQARLELEDKLDLREDSNFRNMVEASRRALLFLAETDNYYARWLGLLLQELTNEVLDFEAKFSYEDALLVGGRPIPLRRDDFEAHRRDLLTWALSGYLTHLEELTPEDKAQLKGGWLSLKFKDPRGP